MSSNPSSRHSPPVTAEQQQLHDQLNRIARLDSSHPESLRLREQLIRQLYPSEHDAPFSAHLGIEGQHLRLHRLAGTINLSIESACGHAEFQIAEGHPASGLLRRLMCDLRGTQSTQNTGVSTHQIGRAPSQERAQHVLEFRWGEAATPRQTAIPESVATHTAPPLNLTVTAPLPMFTTQQKTATTPGQADALQRQEDAARTQVKAQLNLSRRQVDTLATEGMLGKTPDLSSTTSVLRDLLALRGVGTDAPQVIPSPRVRDMLRRAHGGMPLHPEEIQLCLIDLCDLHASICEDQPAPALTATV